MTHVLSYGISQAKSEHSREGNMGGSSALNSQDPRPVITGAFSVIYVCKPQAHNTILSDVCLCRIDQQVLMQSFLKPPDPPILNIKVT